ncbi:MAG: nucleoside monophosphate kinase [Pseudomonadota bacterium]
MDGSMVRDEIFLQTLWAPMVEPECCTCGVLDRTARTTPQAVAVDHLLHSERQQVNAVIALEVGSVGTAPRINGRLTLCDTCDCTNLARRAKDNGHTVMPRLGACKSQTVPLITRSRAKRVLNRVSAMQDISDIGTAAAKIVAAETV